LGVVDDTVSVVLIPTWFTLLLLFDGWSSNSVIRTGPWNKLSSSEINIYYCIMLYHFITYKIILYYY
jgi:hypothetical protein